MKAGHPCSAPSRSGVQCGAGAERGPVGVQVRGCERAFHMLSGSSLWWPCPMGLCAHSGLDTDPASWEPRGAKPLGMSKPHRGKMY